MKLFYRYGCRLIFSMVCLMLLSGCAVEENQLLLSNKTFETAKSDFAGLPENILEDSKDTFTKTDNLTILLLAGGATIAMNQGSDKKIAENFDDHEIFHNFSDRGLKTLGNPGFHFAGAGLWYLLSSQNQDEFNKERAWVMIRALSVTGLATAGLKAVRDNKTPVGNKWAWPSGHTSSSFTVAAVLDEFYGPSVGIPAYAAASLVGLRMMDQGDHWASDVVFGAALGWVVGHTIAGQHRQLEIASFKVIPYVLSDNGSTMGVSLIKHF